LQPQHNSGLRELPSEKGKGIAGTTILHVVVFLLLIFVGFTAPKPPEQEKGILVNFGTDETGAGLIEPSPPASNEKTVAAQPKAAEIAVKEQANLTQNFDKEAPEIKKADPEAEKKKKELLEAEKVRKAQIEADRIRKVQEDAEKAKIAAEEKRISNIQNRAKNALANSKNSGTNSTGEGITGGAGNQGDPRGSVDSNNRGPGGGTGDKGISYDLAGRNFLSLPEPKYDIQAEGKVVVDIYVDRTGKVTSAIPGGKYSTSLDENLLNAAKEAALKAKFESKPEAPLTQKGTITYNFKLK
jgi:colicin import membrane protein